MSSTEERLWDYIDGKCTADEEQTISLLIEQDELFREKYLEMLQLNKEFSAIELEEPPMAFTYNVMETIRAEHAQKSLKATINPVIIKIIAAFFILTIIGLLVFTLTTIHWANAENNVNTIKFQTPDFTKYINGWVLKGFLFFDVVLGLFFIDTYLRKKSNSKTT